VSFLVSAKPDDGWQGVMVVRAGDGEWRRGWAGELIRDE